MQTFAEIYPHYELNSLLDGTAPERFQALWDVADADVFSPPAPRSSGDRNLERSEGAGDMSKTVAEILVDQMVEAGIKKVYGIVGDSANPIVDALRRHEADITFIHVRNEEAGAFAAGADSQISGRPTAVLGSSGPGSVHLLNGLYDCQRNGASVFAIATHIPSAEIGTGYFQETKPDVHLRGRLQLRRHDRLGEPGAARLRAGDPGGDPRSRCRLIDPAGRHRRGRGAERGDQPPDHHPAPGDPSDRRRPRSRRGA